MANQERTFEAAGKSYTIRFTQNAFYRLEEKLGEPVQSLSDKIGLRELQIAMWAGLEGARLKNRDRRAPFSLDEVGDLIDDLGQKEALKIMFDALSAALPKNDAAVDVGEAVP